MSDSQHPPALWPASFIIGLAGVAGVGKSTVARAIQRARGGIVVDGTGVPLKAMLAAFYAQCSIPPAEIARRIDGDLKRAPDPLLGGRTPTEAMQRLGTEWGREQMTPDLWVGAWDRRARAHVSAGRGVVNDSVRFENEAAAIRALGGFVVRIVGPRGDDVGGHISEAGVEADVAVLNAAEDDGAAAAREVLRHAARRWACAADCAALDGRFES
ncbi:hypothetical protein [Oceanicella actignis]|uniref:Dephospho-CoA kinase n=1 Tax=Oceanicella actignis TaxID=1189325 RepID=A0A1M7U1D6_9RHOB|nr:hypothetical protein [Oceanicella actignis]SES77415.1 hypothetical protein SAMN04488119_101420 [Oceanicella actignis]SHN76795.1 hypothetical protein SAMN05216200_1142 [Oceanicella actignis]